MINLPKGYNSSYYCYPTFVVVGCYFCKYFCYIGAYLDFNYSLILTYSMIFSYIFVVAAKASNGAALESI